MIDIHAHVTYFGGPPRLDGTRNLTPEGLIEIYDRLGVDRAVLLPNIGPEHSFCVRTSEEVLHVCREFPDRYIPFCSVDPRALTNTSDAPLGHLLEYYRDNGCRGVGEVTANLPIEDAFVQNLFKCSAAAGLPVTIHMAPQVGGFYGLVDEPGLPGLRATLERHPTLTVLGHSQMFWAEMAPLREGADRFRYPDTPIDEEGATVRLLRDCPNLVGDLSANSGLNALRRDEAYAVGFLNEFQDRLCFGLDICQPKSPTGLVDLLKRFRQEGKISEDVYRKVTVDNATCLLGL